jgi:hypothetical protein
MLMKIQMIMADPGRSLPALSHADGGPQGRWGSIIVAMKKTLAKKGMSPKLRDKAMNVSVKLATARLAEYDLYHKRKGDGKYSPLLDRAKESVQKFHEEYLKLTSPSTADRTRFC